MPVIKEKKVISNHQFDFRSKYATIKQIHRITNKITLAFKAGKYCSAAFLDVLQRLLTRYGMMVFCLKSNNIYQKSFISILKSYLRERHFFHQITCCNKNPQNPIRNSIRKCPWSVIVFVVHRRFTGRRKGFHSRMIRYLQYTRTLAFKHLQDNLNLIQNRLKLWRIKVNENKSIHVAFITRIATCPTV